MYCISKTCNQSYEPLCGSSQSQTGMVKASSPLVSTAKLVCMGAATAPMASGFQISNKEWVSQQIRSSLWRFHTVSWNLWLPVDSLIKTENANGSCWPTALVEQRGSTKPYLRINYWLKAATLEELVALSTLLTPSNTMSAHQNLSTYTAKGKGGFLGGKTYFDLTVLAKH